MCFKLEFTRKLCHNNAHNHCFDLVLGLYDKEQKMLLGDKT